MALLFGGSGGGVFIASVISEEVYDPVFDTEVDSDYIYQLIGSYYRDLMSDREIFEVYWSGLMQAVSGDLLHTWSVDYAKSLRDVPVISQRKWVQLDLIREEDFAVDPALTQQGVGARGIQYSAAALALTGTWSSRDRWDKHYVDLRGVVNEQASLAFTTIFQLVSVDAKGVALVGYMGEGLRLSNSLMAFIYGKVAATSTPSYGIVHFDGFGTPTTTLSTYDLALGIDYRFECSYTAKTGVTVLEIIELRFLRVTGTGKSLGAFQEIYVNQFSDESVNFDDLGALPGDKLLILALEFTIISVDGSVLTVREIAIPAEADDISYTLLGEKLVNSISLDIPGDASVPTFTSSQFGTSMLDTRSFTEAFFPGTAVQAARRAIDLIIRDWTFLDPTLDEEIISIPRLQEVITDPQDLRFEGTDYSIRRVDRLRMQLANILLGSIEPGELVVGGSTGSVAAVLEVGVNSIVATLRDGDFAEGEGLEFSEGAIADLVTVTVDPDSTLYFQEPPPEGLWAEYVGYDERFIQNNFGANVDLLGASSDQYKARVRGLYYSFFRGPNVEDIRRGVHILIGLPIAEAAGAVESINLSFSGIAGVITVDTTDYLFPLAVGTELQVGDVVEAFEPLCLGVEVIDYLLEPEWFVNLGIEELLKYHTFLVRLNLDVFSIDTIPLAGRFVQQIKPTWKQGVFVAVKNLEDELIVSDDCEMHVSLFLEDTPCDAVIVTYDGMDYAETGDADWLYDQGQTNWDATSAGMRGTATEISGVLSLTPASTQGDAEADAGGEAAALLAEIGGAGPHTDKYLALGLYLTGLNGATTIGSHTFTEVIPGALAGVEVGDRLTIVGKGDFAVVTVDVAGGFLLLDNPSTVTDTNLTWFTTGSFDIWAQVTTVDGSDTFLDFTSNYPNAAAKYKMALLDVAYREAYYDQFEEACPNEYFTLNITLETAATGLKSVPQADGSVADYNFTFTGETYSVTLDEPDGL